MVMNNGGWIRIVEAFIAILLVTGVLLIVLGENFGGNKDYSSEIHDTQLAVLRDIQVNEDLREDILSVTTPIESRSGNFPLEILAKIDSHIPSYLECIAKICELDLECSLDDSEDKSIYVQSIVITVIKTSDAYDPKQLKLFCWMK